MIEVVDWDSLDLLIQASAGIQCLVVAAWSALGRRECRVYDFVSSETGF